MFDKKSDNFSKTIKLGRIAHRTDLYTDPSNCKQYIRFSLAINKSKDKPDYYSCVVYNATARYFDRHIRTGDKVLIVGTDCVAQKVNGNGMHYKLQQVTADSVFMYDSKEAKALLDEMETLFHFIPVCM